jgi:hypothetical protein
MNADERRLKTKSLSAFICTANDQILVRLRRVSLRQPGFSWRSWRLGELTG